VSSCELRECLDRHHDQRARAVVTDYDREVAAEHGVDGGEGSRPALGLDPAINAADRTGNIVIESAGFDAAGQWDALSGQAEGLQELHDLALEL